MFCLEVKYPKRVAIRIGSSEYYHFVLDLLRNSYRTISNMGGFSESDLAVLKNTLNQDLSDYASPDVELVVSPVDSAVPSPTAT
jgi:hypothetical protein